ncbi:MAG: trehalose-6-phosphate synthase [candidate division Zixibacteria bacterium]|nr:trehalose-6-phosphate synthase [candidate division Zixibacteria bacterium]
MRPIVKFNKFVSKIKEATDVAIKKALVENDMYISSHQSLIDLIRKKLSISKFIIVSNREPYLHFYEGDSIRHIRYASGLTIALDPIANLSQGTWVAHGSGDADMDTTDEKGKVMVPPDDPKYTLKRIWLSKKEEYGYYYGFSNQVLWPLCHVAYIRPKFELAYWNYYQRVNQLFAQAVVEEVKGEKGLVFLQDYHLALCARYIKELDPNLTTILFWHIPWPNPEIFRICPWKIELLEGLLSNDSLGFHLSYHADNFLKTVALELEAKIDYEKWAVVRGEKSCLIKSYPISVDYQKISSAANDFQTEGQIQELKKYYRLKDYIIGIGIDRIDYTKGIPERLKALDRFLEKYPQYQGKLTFIQIAVPSRVHLEVYQDMIDQIEKMVEDINWKYSQSHWSPIIYIKKHHDFREIIPFYKMADFCIVSSLHDGMNLVAKEYISSKTELNGVLILSCFTGSARELEQALLVNPYDAEKFAEAIKEAVEMKKDEKRSRMEKMREVVSNNTVYHWAEKIISDLIKL